MVHRAQTRHHYGQLSVNMFLRLEIGFPRMFGLNMDGLAMSKYSCIFYSLHSSIRTICQRDYSKRLDKLRLKLCQAQVQLKLC